MFYPLGKKKLKKSVGVGGGNGWHPLGGTGGRGGGGERVASVGCPFFVSLNLVVLSPV